MQFTEQFHDVFHELLDPVRQTLSDGAAPTAELSHPQERLRHAAETLEDLGDAEAASVARTLAGLLEIADVSSFDEADGAAETRSEIVAFTSEFLETACDPTDEETEQTGARLTEMLQSADERWGETLRLIGEESSWLLEEPTSTDLESSGDSSEAEASDLGAGQVDLILSTLTAAVDDLSDVQDDRPAASVQPSVDEITSAAENSAVSPPQTVELSPDMLEAYLEDACACLASMERAALDLENDPTNSQPITQLCRELHTLKGASASVGLSDLATQLHEVEETLENPASLSPETGVVDLVMDCVDAVRTKINTLQSAGEPAATESVTTVGEADAVSSIMPVTGDNRSDGRDSVRVKTEQLDRLMDLLAELVVWRRRRDERVVQLDTAADELSRSLTRLESIDDRQEVGLSSASDRRAERSELSSNYLTEIGNDLREITRSLRQSRRGMAEENRAVSQFILQFRQELVQIRRVPLAGLFQRLHRSVREAARVEGKEVRLELIGEHAGLERSLQERLYEPLLHLVRNAVSHGLETPEQRVKAGKDRVGTVTVEAYGSSHVLIIEIRDDGRGLDYDAIRRRGLEQGLIYPDRPVSDSELARLIFRSGFTTRDEASEISGRGVGMDVVATVLDRCHCHIETESESGKGTRFRLTMPLRSVIEHALLFRCGGQSFGLPMQYVRSASQTGHESRGVADGPGAVDLGDLLQLTERSSSQSRSRLEIGDRLSSSLGETSSDRAVTEHRLGLVVDEVLGSEEVVVRPLPPLLRRHPHLCGATLSGTGDVVLLLDGRRLVQDNCDRDAEHRGGSTGRDSRRRTGPTEPFRNSGRRRLDQCTTAAHAHAESDRI